MRSGERRRRKETSSSMQTIAHQSDIICTQLGLRTFKHVKMQARDFNYKIKWNFLNNFDAPGLRRDQAHISFRYLSSCCCCRTLCILSICSMATAHNCQNEFCSVKRPFIHSIFFEFYLNFHFLLFLYILSFKQL